MAKDFLFIVHVEPMFEQWMGEDFLFRLGKHFDQYHTILLDSEVDESGGYEFLQKAVDEVWHWSWGYEEGFDEHTIRSDSPHEWTWVPEELRSRVDDFTNGRKVFISGGGESECLWDWEEVLDHLGIPYQKIYDIVY